MKAVQPSTCLRDLPLQRSSLPVLTMLIALYLVVFASRLYSQEEDIRFERISIEHGLSDASISSICQDYQGFLWFGTLDGLNRYDGYNFKVFHHDPSDSSSLCSSSIRAIFEDSSNILWVGTNKGLNRFDRERETFRRYLNDPDDKNSFGHNGITSICEDSKGRLWVGTNFGLIEFNRTSETFRRYNASYPAYNSEIFEFIDSAKTEERTIASITEIGNNVDTTISFEILNAADFLVISTGEGGSGPKTGPESKKLFDYGWLEGNKKIWEMHIDSTIHAGGASKNRIQISVLNLKPGKYKLRYRSDDSHSYPNWNDLPPDKPALWGIQVLSITPEMVSELKKLLAEPLVIENSISGDGVTSIIVDSDDKLWIGLGIDGLNRLDLKTRVFEDYGELIKNRFHLNAALFTDRLSVDSKNLWIGTRRGGLYSLNKETGVINRFINDPQILRSISDNRITAIYRDQSGKLWIGTDEGLNLYNPDNQDFLRYSNRPDDEHSLSHNKISDIYQDSFGVIWIGTPWGTGVNKYDPNKIVFNQNNRITDVGELYEDREGMIWLTPRNGLIKYDPAKDEYTHFNHDPNNPNSLSNDYVYAIAEDYTGMLWFGTWNGLNKFDHKKRQFTRYFPNPGDVNSIGARTIVKVVEDKQNVLWMGSLGGGLAKYDRELDGFISYLNVPGDTTGISDNYVEDIYEDRNGYIWIGTRFGGLNRFDRETETFKHYVNDPTNPLSIPKTGWWEFCEDQRGVLWIGTGEGLSRFNRSEETFTHYTIEDGLANNSVMGLLEDDFGNLWMCTHKGLSRFNPVTETFRNYGPKDGLQGWSFTSAHFKGKNGMLYFGGSNGYNYFHPKSDNPLPPKIAITDFRIFNKSIKPGNDSQLEKSITIADKIKLSYKQNIFSFQFAALHYASPEDNRYAYMMEGFDRDWVYSDKVRTATYTNLSPGSYTFRVKASNCDGIWNMIGTSIEVIVFPPPWKTWWAYTIYILLVLSTAFIAYLRVKRKQTEALARARIDAELKAAQQIQSSLIPSGSHKAGSFMFSGKCIPASEVGGDYFDFRLLDDGRLVIVLGDVSGHGLTAGILVSMAKATLITVHRDKEINFKETLDALNEVIIKGLSGRRMLMTFCYLILDPEKGIIGCSANGHPFPLIANSEGETSEITSIGGYPLGVRENPKFRIIEAPFRQGDTLLLYTDGLPEQVNNADEPWGYENFRTAFGELARTGNSEMIVDGLLEQALKYAEDADQADDMTAVCIEVV